MADRSVTTADNLRDSAGVGSVINTHHEGGLKRRVENALDSKLEMSTSKGEEMLGPAKSTVLSADGNEILTVVDGVVVKREKRLPPGQRGH